MTAVWRIVKIIDNYKVVVNAGTEQGVKRDEILQVYDEGDSVVDPETGETLGTLDRIKCYLRVLHVYPRMCICENAETRNKTWGDILSPMSRVFSAQPMELPVDATQISGGWHGPTMIRVGDKVRRDAVN